jgi:hypothetical protein
MTWGQKISETAPENKPDKILIPKAESQTHDMTR